LRDADKIYVTEIENLRLVRGLSHPNAGVRRTIKKNTESESTRHLGINGKWGAKEEGKESGATCLSIFGIPGPPNSLLFLPNPAKLGRKRLEESAVEAKKPFFHCRCKKDWKGGGVSSPIPELLIREIRSRPPRKRKGANHLFCSGKRVLASHRYWRPELTSRNDTH